MGWSAFPPLPAKTAADKLEQQMMRETYTEFEDIAAKYPESGIAFVPDPENGYVGWPDFRVLPQEEYPKGHENIRLGVSYRCWVLNSPVYLLWLKSRAEGLGVHFVKGQVSRLEDAAAILLPSRGLDGGSSTIVINATGRGLDDPASFPSRGQFVHVANECRETISHHWADGSSTVIIPRPLGGGTIIGGTKEPNDWYFLSTQSQPAFRSAEVSATVTDVVLKRAVELEPGLIQHDVAATSTSGFKILQEYVARRPMRNGGLRLESETGPGKPPIIHCYGAGASGFKISWGVATRVHKFVADLEAKQ
ncbi:hypothetical protein N7468_000189 [Penicillium chermesinum]|uniref:FAD dependent oxidoreductase domain-containing protein n=1 Tax=Penicillium chermesinum TaxID=63820 RepID=A0A9W9PLH2_9EURO|nr:uncharacterized protein N7468_000189 [Penicillium chermesinum]KAJ5248738.1 hypothetical protein N7468_000189 [Penicillium chermesinum]